MSTKTVKKLTKTSKTANKAAKKITKKTTKSAKTKKTSKTNKKVAVAEKKPTLESILDEADRAFTDIVKRYLQLGESLVKAVTYYGNAGKKAFKTRFPLTDNAIRNLELVGRGRLLPQFAMCSDRFVNGLVNMCDSLTWQYKLIGASRNGMIRVRMNGNVVDATFADLKSDKIVDGVLSIISDADKDLTPQEICEKLRTLRRDVRSKFDHEKRPPFEIKTSDGKKIVRFFRSKPYTAEELKKIVAKLEE